MNNTIVFLAYSIAVAICNKMSAFGAAKANVRTPRSWTEK